MIKRKLLEDVKNHLSKKEISLIVGPLQAGDCTYRHARFCGFFAGRANKGLFHPFLAVVQPGVALIGQTIMMPASPGNE
jgi:hypothetical protein